MNIKHEIAKKYILDRLTDAHNAAVELLRDFPAPDYSFTEGATGEINEARRQAREPYVDTEIWIHNVVKHIVATFNPPPPPVCCDKCNQPIPPDVLDRLR